MICSNPIYLAFDGILTAEPHIDVITVQLFDHDTGQDLNVFTPNDWTGRDDEVVGANSMFPRTRRWFCGSTYALWEMGSGPYDVEFVRAQDYELWTRIVGRQIPFC